MKKKLYTIIAVILVVATLAAPSALAGGVLRASNYFNAYSASISKSSTTITISFSVTATGSMTTLGASSIKIYVKNSGIWVLDDTIPGTVANGMLNSGVHRSSSITYTGQIGKEYYAKVTFYAANSGGSETSQPYSTNSVTL